MENFEQPTTEEKVKSLDFNSQIRHYLFITAKWGKFLAIAGYIMMGVLLAVGVFIMIFNFVPFKEIGIGSIIWVYGVFYFGMAVLYYFPITYLYRFSKMIKSGLLFSDDNQVTSAFGNLSSLFRFAGIMVIVVLAIYVLIILIAVPTFIMSMRSY